MSDPLEQLERSIGISIPEEVSTNLRLLAGVTPEHSIVEYQGQCGSWSTQLRRFLKLDEMTLSSDADGMLVIGYDGFGNEFALDLDEWCIYFIDLPRGEAVWLAQTLREFVEKLLPDPDVDFVERLVAGHCSLEQLESALGAAGHRGSVMEYKNTSGDSLIELASLKGNLLVVDGLLKRRAVLGDALAIAARNNRIEICRRLLEAGADPFASFMGKDLLDLPRRLKYSDVVGLVEEARRRRATT